MASKSTAIPNHQPRDFIQRLLEIFTGLMPFMFLIVLVVLSRFNLEAAAVVLLLYTLSWLVRLFGYSYKLMVSFYYLRLAMLIDWQAKLADVLDTLTEPPATNGLWRLLAEKWYQKYLLSGLKRGQRIDPRNIYNAVIIAVSNEPLEIIQSSVNAVVASRYDHKKLILIIAYEERGGKQVEHDCHMLVKKYQSRLKLAKAIKHPNNLPGEAKAKAGNITNAAKYLSSYCSRNKIKASDVLVTVLDADNRPHPQYLAALTWTYALTSNRLHRSYQPIPLFTNNIWDVPAIVRVVAADSSFWFIIQSMQPKRLRLFSAYAQSLKTLQDTNYWNVEVLVEDGHQYWRSYFSFKGDHFVLPVWLPIYQDAVLNTGYIKTLVAQYRQLRRWAWGTADTPWLIRQAFKDKDIPWSNKLIHILRQYDDYIAWSTAPIILSIGGWLPRLLSPESSQVIAAVTLPYIISGIQLFALVGLIVPVALSVWSLPPRPANHGLMKSLSMVLQWVLEPIALVFFISLSSLNAHFRLIVNKPLERWDITAKHRENTIT
ncbi:MAG: glycosyltransferase family protein [Candidatus Saccharimonadales bacterium]